MRGKVPNRGINRFQIGITPAYAGKSSKLFSFSLLCQDHPRLCGEKFSSCFHHVEQAGSPPPMRGKALRVSLYSFRARITPAYAGKSLFCRASHFVKWDHPRLCGEKFGINFNPFTYTGSPPPMRGKGFFCRYSIIFTRITPAYAGKRHTDPDAIFRHQDHPRLCGEKILQRCFLMFVQGSPPPMRGKAGKRYRILSGCGITPAYAGKSTPSARLSAGT